MTTHTNCTHEATKAARARCRRDTAIALRAGDAVQAATEGTFWVIADGEAREVVVVEELRLGTTYLVRTIDTGSEFETHDGLFDTKIEALAVAGLA